MKVLTTQIGFVAAAVATPAGNEVSTNKKQGGKKGKGRTCCRRRSQMNQRILLPIVQPLRINRLSVTVDEEVDRPARRNNVSSLRPGRGEERGKNAPSGNSTSKRRSQSLEERRRALILVDVPVEAKEESQPLRWREGRKKRRQRT
jgi:hypothetical protein